MKIRNAFLNALIISTLFITSSNAQEDEDEYVELEEIIVVTASRIGVTAGGAQDLGFARSHIQNGQIPHPNTLTAEGLLSEYDLSLTSSENCEQTFCVFAEVAPAEFSTPTKDQFFVGLGFTSNIKARNWKREPMHIVAVVDKSGSMGGDPLDLVRTSLLGLTDQLNRRDKLSIVLYGDRSHVYLKPTAVKDSKASSIYRKIKAISSDGSTNMEEGLRVAYDLAFAEQENFKGNTRLILFTDEQPNVGETSADSFIGMAKDASARGIGLTTIGVGVQFDAELATKISSTRGGNLYYLGDKKKAEKIFEKELDYMVSELAYDLKFNLKPHPDMQITGVYGVPGNMLTWEAERNVEFTIPTVFLSSRGGGVFVTLAANSENENLPAPKLSNDEQLLNLAIEYTTAKDDVIESNAASAQYNDKPTSQSMKLASLLVDEYTSLKNATTAHYIRNDPETAYQIMSALNTRVDRIQDKKIQKKLTDEKLLINKLLGKFAFLSGHSSELSSESGSGLWGVWQVSTAINKGDYDLLDLDEKDYVIISPDNRLLQTDDYLGKELNWEQAGSFIEKDYRIQIGYEEIWIDYKIKNDSLILKAKDRSEDVNQSVIFKRVADFTLDMYSPMEYIEEE